VDVTVDPNEAASAVCSDGGSGASAATGDIQAVLDVADSTKGQVYVFGGGGWDGPTTGGQDCSGLTTCARQKAAGPHRPRTARPPRAALKAREVAPSKSQPGDLSCASWGRLGSDVSHVGVYIGDGKIIEASRSAAVTKVSDARLSGPQFVG